MRTESALALLTTTSTLLPSTTRLEAAGGCACAAMMSSAAAVRAISIGAWLWVSPSCHESYRNAQSAPFSGHDEPLPFKELAIVAVVIVLAAADLRRPQWLSCLTKTLQLHLHC